LINDEFNALYKNKEFYNKFKSICHDFYQGHEDALNTELAIYGVDDLEQEGLIEVWQSKSGESISYYLKAVQSRMLDLVTKAESREEIAQFEEIDSNLAYGAYEES